MGKPEASVLGPTMIRPPRPASRERGANGTPEPPAAAGLDTEVVMIHPTPDELSGISELVDADLEDEEPQTPRRTGSVLRVSMLDPVTVPLGVLSAVPAETREARVLDLPLVALEKRAEARRVGKEGRTRW